MSILNIHKKIVSKILNFMFDESSQVKILKPKKDLIVTAKMVKKIEKELMKNDNAVESVMKYYRDFFEIQVVYKFGNIYNYLIISFKYIPEGDILKLKEIHMNKLVDIIPDISQ